MKNRINTYMDFIDQILQDKEGSYDYAKIREERPPGFALFVFQVVQQLFAAAQDVRISNVKPV